MEKFLCELNEPSQEAFGGKLMLLGGDWKQLLPVVRGTHGLSILDYTLKMSRLWKQFQVNTYWFDELRALLFSIINRVHVLGPQPNTEYALGQWIARVRLSFELGRKKGSVNP